MLERISRPRQALERVEEARQIIARALVDGDADTLRELRARASAYELYAQRAGARELANDGGEIKVRTERALGQLDEKENPQGRPRKDGGTPNFSLEGEIEDHTRAIWRRIGRLEETVFDTRIQELRAEESGGVTSLGIAGLDLSALKGAVTVEWYTPARYIDAAREVLGGIDLDPASSPEANKTVKAAGIYTQLDDGLEHDWHGRVWLNPPYGKGTGLFVTKLVEEHKAGRVTQAVLLINAYGFDSGWFQPLWDHLLCFTDHRIVFTSPQRGTGGPANGNLFVYLGRNWGRFSHAFGPFGTIVRRT